MTIANLGIAVDSSQAAKGSVNLDALAASAARAESSVQKLGQTAPQAFNRTGRAVVGVTYQLQDIATQLASGQSPFLIAAQQVPQLTDALGEGRGLKGTLTTVAAGFTSMLSPLNLITFGLVALGGVGVQALASIIPKTESASDALARHTKALKELVVGYRDAGTAVDDYARAAATLPRTIVQQGIGQQFEEIKQQAQQFGATMSGGQFNLFSSNNLGTFQALAGSLNTIDHEVGQLGVDFAAGKITVDEFAIGMDRISRMSFFDLTGSMHAFVGQARDAALALAGLQTAYVNLEHATAASGHNQGVQVALDSMFESKRAAEAQKIELDAINAKSPAAQADIARRRAALDLADEQISDSLRQQKIDEAGALAYAQASHAISESNRMRLLAANQNIATSETELATVGKSVAETQRLTFVRQQLAAAEAEAAQNGTEVSAAYVAEIEKLGDAYGKLQQKIALSKLTDDLAFARSQIGRSPIEQDVATQLRGVYGDDWQQFANSVIADNIRINDTLKDIHDTGQSIVEGFLSDLKSGAKAGYQEVQSLTGNLKGALDTAEAKSKFSGIIDDFQKSVKAGSPAFHTLKQQIDAVVRTDPTNLTKIGNELSKMVGTASRAASGWSILGNAAINALDKIADKALGMAADGIWNMVFGSITAGLTGGIGGGTWGKFGGFSGYSGSFGIPGYASGTDFAPGGVALVGEHGPELVNLPRGSQVVPNNRIGANDNAMPTIHISIDARGATRDAGPSIANEVRRALPDAMRAYQQNPYRR